MRDYIELRFTYAVLDICKIIVKGHYNKNVILCVNNFLEVGARCSSVVRAFAHGAMGCCTDPS